MQLEIKLETKLGMKLETKLGMKLETYLKQNLKANEIFKNEIKLQPGI
jgi:hypothetical protein